jgi:Zn-finger protein
MMSLKQKCPVCNMQTIPKRIIGVYVGSADSIKVWECRECFALWSNKTKIKVGGISVPSA